ncbi:acetyl-CoA carboxylase biotin carboxyl carrier protein subunit [Spongiactinospora gelatinilytica]|uniref:Biotin carboxyl carrier protein of acetyl-CoA carboxylase n=1 Tax=Spongiactinospora gelatinilytica TaxID=2666298 RepID=A0A2W2GSE5_9ACTN|nr:biotin/lipoyl-containing protein [Spongiactinospora gelatinilytica]PZG51381.1 acetyl-CoA carboxylase biotin carboxyl carrier protein subunit [Spongiactinospora gelatinilytica]
MADHGDLIESVYRHAVGFANEVGGPIRRLKVTVGEVSLEAEWPAPGDPGPPVPHLADLNGHHAPAPRPEPPTAAVAVVQSPMVGTFYRSPEPGAPPFVKEGDMVTPGQQVGIVEAMKMMNPVQAATAGRVTKALAEDAGAVEYGQALFALEEG